MCVPPALHGAFLLYPHWFVALLCCCRGVFNSLTGKGCWRRGGNCVERSSTLPGHEFNDEWGAVTTTRRLYYPAWQRWRYVLYLDAASRKDGCGEGGCARRLAPCLGSLGAVDGLTSRSSATTSGT